MNSKPLSSFARRLRREWRLLNLPAEEKTITVAVSGGADSTALLTALAELQNAKKLSLKIIAAHFNHRLRGAHSDEDANFVEKLAAKFDFEFVLGNQKSESRKQKSNLEAAARQARYNFLATAAENFGSFAVLTAHTLDDQAETFFLRLIRGSSGDGLGAMKPIRNLEREILNFKSQLVLIRPLLSWARRETIENYCREREIDFRQDAMNEDLNFARVRIRREVLPLLKTLNPKIVETIAQTAFLLQEDATELNDIAADLLEKSFIEPRSLNALEMAKESAAIRRRILRLWLERERGDLRRIEYKHLQAIESLIFKKTGGRIIELPGNLVVKRIGERIVFADKVEKTRRGI